MRTDSFQVGLENLDLGRQYIGASFRLHKRPSILIKKKSMYVCVTNSVFQSRPSRQGDLLKTRRGWNPLPGAGSYATFGPNRVRVAREHRSKVYYIKFQPAPFPRIWHISCWNVIKNQNLLTHCSKLYVTQLNK